MTQLTSVFYARVFGLVAAALLGIALFKIIEPFIGAILWSTLLAFLLFPVNRGLRRALRDRRALSAMLLTVGVILVLVGPASFLALAFTRQASDLVVRLQEAADKYHMARLSDLLRVPIIEQAVQWAESVTPVSAEQIEAWFMNAAKTLLALIVSSSGVVVVEALSTLVGLVMMLFLLFFFLRDGEDMVQRALGLVPMPPERQAHLIEHLSAVTRAVVFGALAIIAALVPLVGAALVWAPGAAVLAFQGRWGAAIFLVLWGSVVISMVDNIIRPLFISGRAQISTLPVFLGLIGGLSAFGPIGMVLGPVIVALALALFRFAEESRGGELVKPS
jgi:predicted PurR-regulated permease PerM